MKNILLLAFFSTSVLLSIAQTQFEENLLYNQSLSTSQGFITSFDVDEDGDLDILVPDDYNRVNWLENLGDGTFSNGRILIDFINNPRIIEVFDIDGDEMLDLLVSRGSPSSLVWFKNEGMGSFTCMDIDTSINSSSQSICADLDNDGNLDIIASIFSVGEIIYYLNDGIGNFGSKQLISNEVSFPTSVYASDLDGDGLPDVVGVSAFGDYKLAWYKNLGNGNFGPQQIISQFQYFPFTVTAADLDRDGDNDLIVSAEFFASNDRIVFTYTNNGIGSFTLQDTLYTTHYRSWSHHAVDLNNDGDLDILTPSDYFLNDGTGSFLTGNEIHPYGWSSTYGDFNGNGWLDIVYYFVGTCSNMGNLAWKENLSNANYSESKIILYTIHSIQNLIYEDMDGDGLKDILVASEDCNISICKYKNLGSGHYEKADTILMGYHVPSMQLVDLNGDGNKDLLYVIDSTYWNNSTKWLACQMGDSSGNFGPIQILKENVSSVFFAADINSNGYTDILFLKRWGLNFFHLTLSLNDSMGYFGNETTILTGLNNPRDIKTIDINNDGLLDILLTDNALQTGINQGGVGNFQFSNFPGPSIGACKIDYADMNGNGEPDIVFTTDAEGGGNYIGILFNDGSGVPASFTHQILSYTSGSDELVLVDLDKDGDMDIVSAQKDSIHSLFWLENDGLGNFLPGATGSINPLMDSISVADIIVDDLDSDGDIDILYASKTPDKSRLAWFENIGFHSEDSASSCANIPFPLGNQVLTSPGIYGDSLLSIHGLDSIVHVAFTHIPLPQVTLSPFLFDTICIQELSTPVPVGYPANGSYIGYGIIQNEIQLAVAGEGLYTLMYAYEDPATGCSDTAQTQMTVVICTSIEESNPIPGLKVFPNPTSGEVYIQMATNNFTQDSDQTNLELYSTHGQLLLSRTIQFPTETIDIGNYPPGMYYLSIKQNTAKNVFKLIVQSER